VLSAPLKSEKEKKSLSFNPWTETTVTVRGELLCFESSCSSRTFLILSRHKGEGNMNRPINRIRHLRMKRRGSRCPLFVQQKKRKKGTVHNLNQIIRRGREKKSIAYRCLVSFRKEREREGVELVPVETERNGCPNYYQVSSGHEEERKKKERMDIRRSSTGSTGKGGSQTNTLAVLGSRSGEIRGGKGAESEANK